MVFSQKMMTMNVKTKQPSLRPRVPLRGHVPHPSENLDKCDSLVMVGDHISPDNVDIQTSVTDKVSSVTPVSGQSFESEEVFTDQEVQESSEDQNNEPTKSKELLHKADSGYISPNSNLGQGVSSKSRQEEELYQKWERTTPVHSHSLIQRSMASDRVLRNMPPLPPPPPAPPAPSPERLTELPPAFKPSNKVAIQPKALRIQTKTITSGSPGGWNGIIDPSDWYMYSLKLIRNTSLTKNLFELYCMASRKDPKLCGSLSKSPRLAKKETFVPDNLLKVEGQNFDPMSEILPGSSEDISEKIKKVARTSWKTPGEISLLMGREQNRRKNLYASDSNLDSCSVSNLSDYSHNLRDLWRFSQAPENFSKPCLSATTQERAPQKPELHTKSKRPQALLQLTKSHTCFEYNQQETSYREQVHVPDTSNQIKLKIAIKKKKQEIESKIKLPKLRLSGNQPQVTPSGHPIKKFHCFQSRPMAAIKGQKQAPECVSRSESDDSFDSSSGIDPLRMVFNANAPPSTPPGVPTAPNPSPEVEVYRSNVQSHVVKLPDINDGRIDSDSDDDTVLDQYLLSRVEDHKTSYKKKETSAILN